MTGTDKLDKVALVARADEARAARDLRDQQQLHDRGSEQLQQLRRFKLEYESKLREMAESGMAARQLEDYRRFLANLNQAIEQQTTAVAGSDGVLNQRREDWMEKSLRTSSLADFLARRRLEERQHDARQEQRGVDERHATDAAARQDP